MSDGRFDEITAALAAELSPARFRHTLGVLHTATILAQRFGVDLDKVQQAALLHDCAKQIGRDELLEQIETHRLPVDPIDLDYPAILHGPVGAHLASTRFGVTDAEVLDAIHNHPVGSRSPSPVLQVLMAADYCEPTRDFDGLNEIRQHVRTDLRSGLLAILRHKAAQLRAGGKQPHPRAAEMIESLERC